MSLSEKIKSLRKSHNLTQSEFGRIAGVSDKAVSTWESGVKMPRMGSITKICSYFNIKKSELIDEDILASNISAPPNGEQQLIELYRQLNSEGQEKVTDYADDLVNSGKYKKSDTDKNTA